MKKNIKSILLLSISSLLLTACSDNAQNVQKNIPVEYIHGTFSIDVDSPQEIVGSADYVFVGYVNELTDTVYKRPVVIETSTGSKEISSPYTNYNITIIDNIKGSLKKNSLIPIQKSGGINKDGNSYALYEKDVLPQDGKYYIFSAYAQSDGSLLVSGPNCNIELNEKSKAEIMKSEEYKKYKNAYKDEIKNDRKRFISKYVDEQVDNKNK